MNSRQKTMLIEEITKATLNTLGAVTTMLKDSLAAINSIIEETPEPVVHQLPELMTPVQAAAFLQVSRGTLTSRTKSHEIPYVKLGNHTYRYRRSELIDLSRPGKLFLLPGYTAIRKQLKRLIDDAGIEKHITFHCARHTFATLCLTLGIDIYTVSKLLGHSDVRVTQVYAKLVDSKKDEAMRVLSDAID